jgi:hypothetical protein
MSQKNDAQVSGKRWTQRNKQRPHFATIAREPAKEESRERIKHFDRGELA